MSGIPGIGRATRFGVSRTVGFASTLARAALPEGADRRAFQARATGTVTEFWEVALDALVRARLIERTADRLLAEGVIERLTLVVLDHPATDAVVSRIVESPAFERLVLRAAQSDVVDRLLDRVLASEQLDRVVSQIAESDEVRDALRAQSQGMADEVTDELRSRTIAADLLLERFARSVIRRRPAPRDSGPAASGTT
jgi:hypothetical protein